MTAPAAQPASSSCTARLLACPPFGPVRAVAPDFANIVKCNGKRQTAVTVGYRAGHRASRLGPEAAPGRTDPPAATDKAILDAALDAFAENGFAGTSVRDVAGGWR